MSGANTDLDDIRPLPKRATPPVILRFGPPTRLRVLIAESGWPAYQVAAAAGISPITLSRYVNRKRRISPDHRVRLAKVLGCEPEDLLEP